MLDKASIKALLSARLGTSPYKSMKDLPDPYLFKDLEKAAKRLAKAAKDKELIAVVGDFDADGITSCAILHEFFKSHEISHYIRIPHRIKDGYGLNENMVQELAQKGVKLILTADNGIGANEAALRCLKLGITLIISDHHEPSKELPNAYAIVDPKQHDCPFPFKEICGAQVAWYLAAGIKRELKSSQNMSDYLDFLAIAIISDVMPLVGLNRVLLKRALVQVNKSKRPCFELLKKQVAITSTDLAFRVAPLLNAAGRMKDAMTSYEFLTSKSLDKGKELLSELEDLNAQRREQEARDYESAILQVKGCEKVIVVASKDWHAGTLGIVAGRLSKKFARPAIVFKEEEGLLKGSARSSGIDLLELLGAASSILKSFGGHKSAAGLSIDAKNLELFKKNLQNAALEPSESEDIDCLGELDLKDLDFELLDILNEFEPFGPLNPKPTFCLKKAQITKIYAIGEKHLRLNILAQGKSAQIMYFFYEKKPSEELFYDLYFSINKNYYQGQEQIQLILSHIKESGAKS